MGHITWCDNLMTGVSEIDEQHKKLTTMINELYSAHMNGKDKDVLSSIITGISDYTNYHFATEEKLMLEYDFPHTAEHKEKHREFTERSIEFLIAYTEDKKELTREVLDFLTDWWTSHIKGTDRELTDFLLERGV